MYPSNYTCNRRQCYEHDKEPSGIITPRQYLPSSPHHKTFKFLCHGQQLGPEPIRYIFVGNDTDHHCQSCNFNKKFFFYSTIPGRDLRIKVVHPIQPSGLYLLQGSRNELNRSSGSCHFVNKTI